MMNKFFNSLIDLGGQVLLRKMKENKAMGVEILNKNINIPIANEKEEAKLFSQAFDGIIEFVEILLNKLKK